MVTTPYAAGGRRRRTGTVVDKQTYAPFHQHFLVARLDLDVDGEANTVMEVDSRALPVSEDNPYGLAVVTEATPVRSESEAARDCQLGDASERGRWSTPTGPTRSAPTRRTSSCRAARIPPLMDPDTPQYLRAPVIGHTAVGDPAPRRGALALRRLPDPVGPTTA